MSMDAETVRQLQLAREGDVEAFGYVATAVRPWVAAWVANHGGDEDAVQEALLAAWRNLPALRETAAFPAWLKALARTAALRQHRRAPDVLEAPDAPAELEPDALVSAEAREAVRGAVSKLSPAMRTVIERHYVQGEKVADIARATGLPPGTVKRRLHEAREQLRARLSSTGGADLWS